MTFATPKLPATSRRSRSNTSAAVLASVLAPIIDRTVLSRSCRRRPFDRTRLKRRRDLPVPGFKAIDGTSLQRAVNTDKDVIQSGAVFYYCSQGVWFTSKSATGPWQVATTIPAEIYKIPASSPSHHVTYVVVEKDDNDNDDWVTFAYVAGYTGLMIGWGCAVWGSGWYYPPYHGGILSLSRPTYAAHKPWTGAFDAAPWL